MVDGRTDVGAIEEFISQSYRVKEGSVRNFFVNLSRQGFISMSETPQTLERRGKAPIRVASVELTEKCNLRCDYCYGGFSPLRDKRLSFEEAKVLFDSLRRRNVKVLELSGGEPTVNPEFDKILRYACEHFLSVTVMTNAVAINDGTFELFKRFCEKVGFSISIDGFSEATNKPQRGVANTFSKTLDNILRIKREVNPKFLRVVYMLTERNAGEAADFIDLMVSKGIPDVMLSIPENVGKGRSHNMHYGCAESESCVASDVSLRNKVDELGRKYKGVVRTVADRLGEDGLQIANAITTCGAGWTMLSFQADGRVMPCNMMNDKWCLGNFKEDPNLDFLSFDNPLYGYFASFNLSADDGNRAECESCAYDSYCGKCLNKVLLANKRRAEQGLPLCPVLARNKSLTPCEI